MNSVKHFVENLSVRTLTLFALALSISAFLLNLGTIAFIGDEAIRTLVAFEMKLSGNYIVPTLNGEGYYNKPPLFNWFVLGMSELFGYFGEWPTRLTSLVFLAGFACTVYYYVRKHFDQLVALTMCLMFLTSGRILFWDSMLGLIDICFSWVIFLNFMILFDLAKSRRWGMMFILSYLLFSIAFLLKGLPAAVFQGISIITSLVVHGSFRQKIFSFHHFAGIGLGLIPMVFYYVLYAHEVSLDQVFSILLDQSMQRTVTHHGLWETVVHILTFPFEQVYHFLPWSLLLIVFFHPKCKTRIQQNAFIRFCFWMLVANLPVYWISVQVFPRYLLMFIPLFNLIGYYVLQQSIQHHKGWFQLFRITFLTMTAGGMVVLFFMPLDERASQLNHMPWIWLLSSLLITCAFICLLSDIKRTFLWFAITLLIVRSAFNLVVLPIRALDYSENICREDCLRVAEKYRNQKWFIFGETYPREVARFYTSGYTNQIIHHVNTATDSSALYLVDRISHPDFPGRQVDSLVLENGEILALMRL